MPIGLFPSLNVQVIEGKLLPNGTKSRIFRVVLSFAISLFEFGVIDLIAFDKKRVEASGKSRFYLNLLNVA